MTRPKIRQRTYTDETKAAAMATLAAEGGNARKAARVTGISSSTIRGWAKSPMPVAPELIEEAKGKLDAILEEIAGRLAQGINRPDVLAKILSRPVQAATVMGITVDKLIGLRTKVSDESKMSLAEFLSAARWVEDQKVGTSVPKPLGPTGPKELVH
jgi:hypothetical protein